MLVTDDASPNEDAIDPQLYTITAGGFPTTCDAFASDRESDGLWFCSMVGSQTALKAIWAALLKQPPEAAFLIRGADGMPHAGGYHRCIVPNETIGTWATTFARLPAAGGWHALVCTRMAEFAFERDSFPLLAQSEHQAPALYRRFLDRRSDLPLHHSSTDWLWRTGLDDGTVVAFQSAGIAAYRCLPEHDLVCERLSEAVASGRLALDRKQPTNPFKNGMTR